MRHTIATLLVIAIQSSVLVLPANAGQKKYAGGSQPLNSAITSRALTSNDATKNFAGDSRDKNTPAPGATESVSIADPVPISLAESQPVPTQTKLLKIDEIAPKKLLPIDAEYQTVAKKPAAKKRIIAASVMQKLDPVSTGSVCKTPKLDSDLRRNLKRLKRACTKLHTVKDGRRTWKIYTITNGKSGPLWAVLHDNENAAFDAAVFSMNKYGGTIVAVEAGESRNFKGKDPNRNFGSKCGKARNYTSFMMKLARKGRRVIAMHTNSKGYSGGGGSGHINIFRKSSVLIGYPSKSAKGALKSGDNFIMIPGKGNIGAGAKARIKKLNKKGIHAMYERVTKAGNDCSMSNHVVLTSGIKYFNVEVQHGKSSVAKKLAGIARKL